VVVLCVYMFFVGGSFVRVHVFCGWQFCACTCFLWVVVMCAAPCAREQVPAVWRFLRVCVGLLVYCE